MIARVYSAINAVTAELATSGIVKERLNARDNYLYRSVDDVMMRLSPLLARHKLCILPRVLERSAIDRQGEGGDLLVSVAVRAAFDLVSVEDGSTHTVEAFGEALDAGDKGTAKAMQSAYKYAMLQAFCVPAAQGEDADAASHRLRVVQLEMEPDQGWRKWTQGFEESIGASSSREALQRLQDEARGLLASLSRENPELYSRIGEAIAARRAELSTPPKESVASPDEPRGKNGGARQKVVPQPARSRRRVPAPEPNGSARHA